MFKVKSILATLALTLGVGIGSTAVVNAANPITSNPQFAVSAGKQDACEALKAIDATHGCGSQDTTISRIIRGIISVLSYLVGIVSVIMVIIAGFKYVTSGGDSGRVASAKTTLIYALVGLVIVALAQVIVSTVLKGTTGAITDCPTNKTITIDNPACKP